MDKLDSFVQLLHALILAKSTDEDSARSKLELLWLPAS